MPTQPLVCKDPPPFALQDEIEQFEDAFKMFDKDGGGSINAEASQRPCAVRVRCWDLHAVVSPLPLALSEIVRPLELQELGGVMRTLGQDPSEEDLKKIIAEVDQDGSGALACSLAWWRAHA